MNSVTPEELRQWAAYIKTICGNTLDQTKGYLIESRLSPLALETQSVNWSDLLLKVKADMSGAFRRKVINGITTNETSFFRDSAPFDLLQFKIIPEIIDKRKAQALSGKTIPIRIWSAACSTGQEVYSTAMVIRELLNDDPRYDVRILGTDISDRAVSYASYGKYTKLEIERGLPPLRLSRFCKADGDFWRIRDEIRAMATFKHINLLEPFAFPAKFDLIFCRNVAIYFNEDDRKKLYDRLAGALADDGYLIIGSTESLTGLTTKYESKRYLRSVFYEKGMGG
jgi:chemotaxis protein methyltransferase CheR